MTEVRFADASAPYRTLTVVTAEQWPDLRDTHPAKDWLSASGFDAGLGDLRLIPGAHGVVSAIAGMGNATARARLRFGLANVSQRVGNLPLQVGCIDRVMVHYRDLPDTCTAQVQRYRRAQTASAND